MKRRAMTSKQASKVKLAGHLNELHFAELIGGEINRGSHTDKKDVIDQQHRSHSVKAGMWWQIFLYGRERLQTNTIFQGLGSVANIMIECIDAYPPQYADYQSNKIMAKTALQPAMRKLLAELQKPLIFKAFLDKSLFDGGNAEYFSLFPGLAKTPKQRKEFHIFHKNDVVTAVAEDIIVRNSKARNKTQMDDLKVILWSQLHKKNLGEIEDRHDSEQHYREMKFRLNGPNILKILQTRIGEGQTVSPQVITYGKAIAMFKPQRSS